MPAGEVGVLGFRAPEGRGPRYHADPEKTAKAYIAPGVFTLGDVGYVDEDGYVYITDRIADMVVSGGVNLYPAESEKVLATHPAVAAGRGDRRAASRPRGEPARPGGAGRRPARPGRAGGLCRATARAYKVPRAYEFRTELIYNAMGKLDKKADARSVLEHRTDHRR